MPLRKIVARVIGAVLVLVTLVIGGIALVLWVANSPPRIQSAFGSATPSETSRDLGLTIFSSGMTGGFVSLIPVIPAHDTASRFFTELFGGHEFEANQAGQPFDEFMYTNAKPKTNVTCRTLQGSRVSLPR